MSEAKPQNFKNHGSTDPWFHYVLFLILILNFLYSICHLVLAFVNNTHTFQAAWFVVLSFALCIFLVKLRTYPLKVQDRVIRLEERLRLQSLAPADWQKEILRLSEGQLIGLRFAPDEEVVALARQALAENLTRKQIKERIKNWRADNFRI
jgi:hypothetical protein